MIDLIIADDNWTEDHASALAERALGAVQEETADPLLSRTVSALLTSDEEVRTLNRDYRDKDKPTNVLSFPADDMPGLPEEAQMLGDLALAFGTCAREAEEKGVTFDAHVSHLFVHGLLHLLGYDHETEEEADEMENLERRILARLDIGDPYADLPG